jgi:hypothetical protein
MILFGFWFSKQIESLEPDSVYKKLAMFESAENQIGFVQPFFDNLKNIKKDFVAIQKNHNKPPKTKRTRKSKKDSDETDNDFVSDMVEVASSDTIPDIVTDEPVVAKKKKPSRKNKNQGNPLIDLINSIPEDDNDNEEEHTGEQVTHTNADTEPVITNEKPTKISKTKKVKTVVLPLANESNENTSEHDVTRKNELEKMTGQQLRDILSVLKGMPTGKSSSPGAKNKEELIKLIITIEKQKQSTTEPIATEPIATEPIATEVVATATEPTATEVVATETEPIASESIATEQVVQKKKKGMNKKIIKETTETKAPEPEMNVTRELTYEQIDTKSLYSFEHDGNEYLRDNDYNVYSCDNVEEKIGRFVDGVIIEE